jgi:hypothetical protein
MEEVKLSGRIEAGTTAKTKQGLRTSRQANCNVNACSYRMQEHNEMKEETELTHVHSVWEESFLLWIILRSNALRD